MQAEIIYKPIRHGYAKITKEGNLQLCIPSRLRDNEKFKKQFLEKGEKLLIRYNKKNHIQSVTDEYILLFGEQVPLQDLAPTAQKRTAELKQILYDYAKPILDEYSQKISINYKELKIRKVTAKWGSCTSDQRIMLNTNLVHLPTRLIIYVIIHEACHLKIKNHSPRFRKLVEIYCPNYKILRKELRNYVLK
ncbi:MAG: M48 family metallopeptidase [Candidatus Absconditabacteria bacterium]|nr:M48 family metallopeptidase [Candidatus Absconditabacteria bacterium]